MWDTPVSKSSGMACVINVNVYANGVKIITRRNTGTLESTFVWKIYILKYLYNYLII